MGNHKVRAHKIRMEQKQALEAKPTEVIFCDTDDVATLACDVEEDKRSKPLEDAMGGCVDVWTPANVWTPADAMGGCVAPLIETPLLSQDGEAITGIRPPPPADPPAAPDSLPPPMRKHQDWPRGRCPRRSLRSTSLIEARASEHSEVKI